MRIAKTVFVATDRTHRWRHCVVDFVDDRLQRMNEGKNCLEIVIVQIAVRSPWHDWIDFSCADLARANRLDECGFIVIGNSTGIGREIQRRDQLSAEILQIGAAGKRRMICLKSLNLTPIL